MVQRLTYRRRHSYATRSNKVRKVKTPGEDAALCMCALEICNCSSDGRGTWIHLGKEYSVLQDLDTNSLVASEAYGTGLCMMVVMPDVLKSALDI